MLTNPTIETILTRRSIRSYKDTPVPREMIETILECGKFAATALGKQPWHFTVVTNRDVLDMICRESGFDAFRGAPCAILASFEIGNGTAGEIDCANAIENMALAARSLGLGSCYAAAFRNAFMKDNAEDIKKQLGIPANYKPTLSLALGYTDVEPGERAPRREGTVNWIE